MTLFDTDQASGLTRFSMDRRITVLVLFVSVLVVGMVAALGIPLELVPRGYSEPFLGVYVPWRDAPAPEVEEKLTLPLEEELSSVKGLAGISSWSTTGYVRCWLRFKQGTDMDVAYREVRDRIERARLQFPDDVERIYIRKHDASGIPVAVFGLAVDPELTDAYDLIQNEIVLPLSRIDGVATVEADGLEEKEILIELDRARVESAGLNIYDLALDLGGDNFTMASGTVRAGARKLLLRSVARFDTVADLERRLVADDVRLDDVATITYAEPEKDYAARVFGKPAVALLVLKEGQANTMEVSQRAQAVFDEVKRNPRLQTMEMVSLFNQGDVIAESLDTLFDSGKIGGLFAVVVLFSFLRRFRMTAIITLSIPLSIVIGLTVMYFAGETLNLISLLGLMICVGLLVDNSVVVAENIHRLHRAGASRRDACLRGAGEIALAITTATLTTIVVFLPVSLVEGPGQFFLLRLALPISVSLVASLGVALVFIPLAVYLTLPRRGNGRRDGRWRRAHEKLDAALRVAYAHTLERINDVYTRTLGFFLDHRLDLVLAIAAVFAITVAFTRGKVELTEMQEEERAGFEIDVDLPADTTLEEASEYFQAAEKVVESRSEELGLDGYFVFHRATWGEIQGWFTNPRTTDLSPREVTRIVADALPEKAGAKIYTGEESEIEEEKGKEVHVVVLNGDDYETLERVAQGLEELLAGIDGVLGLRKSGDRRRNELALVVDREAARRHGVSPTVVAGLVGYALRGASLPRFRAEGREIPVRIRFQEEDRQGLDQLRSFYVPTADGAALPLSAVTDSEVVDSYRGIYRRDKRVTRTITLELEDGREKEARERIDAFMAGVDLPEGVTRGRSASRQSMDEDVQAMQFAALLSIVFIYLLMGFLFESFILPLSILLTIPLASIGVLWIHFLTGRDLDFLGIVGGILLIGVVVNNGIVLIDYVSRLRARGTDRHEALLQAAHRRFRPIMMTALTTICGTVPLTVGGANSIGLSYTSFGLTLIGGMTTGTVLTLLVVPIFYTLFDDARARCATALRRALAWGAGRAGATEA